MATWMKCSTQGNCSTKSLQCDFISLFFYPFALMVARKKLPWQPKYIFPNVLSKTLHMSQDLCFIFNRSHAGGGGVVHRGDCPEGHLAYNANTTPQGAPPQGRRASSVLSLKLFWALLFRGARKQKLFSCPLSTLKCLIWVSPFQD